VLVNVAEALDALFVSLNTDSLSYHHGISRREMLPITNYMLPFPRYTLLKCPSRLYTYNSMQISLKHNNLPYFDVDYKAPTQTPHSKINLDALTPNLPRIAGALLAPVCS
jgi:hypothetical protein